MPDPARSHVIIRDRFSLQSFTYYMVQNIARTLTLSAFQRPLQAAKQILLPIFESLQ